MRSDRAGQHPRQAVAELEERLSRDVMVALISRGASVPMLFDFARCMPWDDPVVLRRASSNNDETDEPSEELNSVLDTEAEASRKGPAATHCAGGGLWPGRKHEHAVDAAAHRSFERHGEDGPVETARRFCHVVLTLMWWCGVQMHELADRAERDGHFNSRSMLVTVRGRKFGSAAFRRRLLQVLVLTALDEGAEPDELLGWLRGWGPPVNRPDPVPHLDAKGRVRMTVPAPDGSEPAHEELVAWVQRSERRRLEERAREVQRLRLVQGRSLHAVEEE